MLDKDFLELALQEALQANFHNIKPNPFVGAIVVDQYGKIVGRGRHQQLGGPHAEVYAIQDAKNTVGDHLTGCTLYVTLEPCSHHGRTPPCTALIVSSGIQRVVVASEDPNPRVSGIAWLRSHGVEVVVYPLTAACDINKVFFCNQLLKRPFISIKMAASINGKISAGDNNQQWISNAKSRSFLHDHLRTDADGILSTARTIIHDNATLNIRLSTGEIREQHVVVLDRNLALLRPENQSLAIFYPRQYSKIYLITAQREQIPTTPRNVEICYGKFDSQGRLLWDDCLSQLFDLGFCHLLTEAGRDLTSSLFLAQCVDEFLLFVAPTLIFSGEKFNLFDEKLLATLEGKWESWKQKECRSFGDDVFLRYAVKQLQTQTSNL